MGADAAYLPCTLVLLISFLTTIPVSCTSNPQMPFTGSLAWCNKICGCHNHTTSHSLAP